MFWCQSSKPLDKKGVDSSRRLGTVRVYHYVQAVLLNQMMGNDHKWRQSWFPSLGYSGCGLHLPIPLNKTIRIKSYKIDAP